MNIRREAALADVQTAETLTDRVLQFLEADGVADHAESWIVFSDDDDVLDGTLKAGREFYDRLRKLIGP